ncbi:hypothetical protein, partial [Nocardia farcinica]|uniref:hypothetical protein n=1 Tax=Nocardia farcinica TaxID=37329 RepID=UPI002456B64B
MDPVDSGAEPAVSSPSRSTARATPVAGGGGGGAGAPPPPRPRAPAPPGGGGGGARRAAPPPPPPTGGARAVDRLGEDTAGSAPESTGSITPRRGPG